MQFLVFVNAINECLYALQIHSIVAGSTETAYETVTLDSHHATLSSKLEEIVLQVFVTRTEHEADVHAATIFLVEDSRYPECWKIVSYK